MTHGSAPVCDTSTVVTISGRVNLRPEQTIAWVGGWLDMPETSYWAVVRVRGWVLIERGEPTVIVRSGAREWRTTCQLARPDVAARHPGHPRAATAGFEVAIPCGAVGEELAVLIEANGVVTPWWRFDTSRESSPDARNVAWRILTEGVRPQELQPLTIAEAESAAASVRPLLRFVDAHAADAGKIAGDELALELAEWFANAGASRRMADALAAHGNIDIETSNNGMMRVDVSVAVADANFLVLRGYARCAVLVQYSWSAIALYMPDSGLILGWSPWNEYATGLVLRFVRQWMLDAHKLSDASGGAVLAGFLLGNSRPYHYFYDQLAFLATGDDWRDVPVVVLEDCAFLAPDDVGLAAACTRVASAAVLNAANYAARTFVSMLGCGGDPELTPARKREALRAIGRAIGPDVGLPGMSVGTLRACFPVVWLGVASQKRTWIEQVEGLTLILTRLRTAFPTLGVVFDGWTRPLAPSDSDLHEIERDKALVDDILAKVGNGIPVCNIVGATSAEKIAVARLCDFYVTNWLQGSLHVDNIAARSGIGHFNSQWRYFDGLYTHHDCRRIPDQLIEDVGDGRPDLVSYRIAPEDVFSELVRLLDSISIARVRGLLQ